MATGALRSLVSRTRTCIPGPPARPDGPGPKAPRVNQRPPPYGSRGALARVDLGGLSLL
jgi:hypothetical protein